MTSSERFLQTKSFRPDYPTVGGAKDERGADGRLRLHETVLDGIRDRPRIGKRLSIVAQQMAALGRSTIVKGCSDPVNRGWRRTPLGGHHGMHYYLWWSPQGTRQTRKFKSLERNSILVRAIRHHDDHSPLNVGRLMDYYKLDWLDIDGDSEGCFDTPWTDTQQLFALEDKPVRLVYGYPGSGKTAALWRAVEARSSGRTLYLSWSRSLIEHARARFNAFAPADSVVDARDFSTFLGELCGADVRRQALAASRKAFLDAYAWWKISDHLGPWRNRMDALHAELRAVLFGCAVPGMFECDHDDAKLSDPAYLGGGVSSVGPTAGTHVLDLVRRSGWRGWYEDVFPELASAKRALALLSEGRLPDALSRFDRIVVDEVQDLTLLEAAVVAQYCRVLALKRNHAPWLLLAFDDGQTVRPSGFHSGRLNRLLTDWLTAPEEFNLEHNVRSPGPIARVVERASVLYAVIRKGARPVDQHSRRMESEGASAVDARLIYTEIENKEEVRNLLAGLADVHDVAMVTPEANVPNWVPPESRSAILTPEEAKGLEYSSVCVLDLGPVLARLRRSVDEQDPLVIHERRTAIDRLRVALSRATENLVLIDVDPDDRSRQLCMELLGSAERFTSGDLLELFEDADYPPDERIFTRTSDARRLADVSLERAWERALQALRLLQGAGGRALVEDESVQAEVCLTVLGVASLRLVEEGTDRATREAVVSTAEAVTEAWGSPDQLNAVRELALWTANRVRPPLDLLQAGLKLDKSDRAWLDAALAGAQQALRQAIERCPENLALAHRFAGDVERMLEITGFMGDADSEARRLRQVAVDTLADAAEFTTAGEILARVESPQPRQLAIVSEGLGRHAQAARAFEKAGMQQPAFRNWRKAGQFEKALPYAKGKAKADLQWMIRAEKLMQRRPDDIQNRLTAAERKRLEAAKRMPARRRQHPVPVRGGRKGPRRARNRHGGGRAV